MRTVIFPEQSAVAYFFYFLMLGMLVVTLAAYLSIIRKAGYSAWWILLPGADAMLYVILMTLLFYVPQTATFAGITYSTPASLDDYEALALLTFALGIASGIAFLVFAFSTWPIERELRRVEHRAREARSEAVLVRAAPAAPIVPRQAPPAAPLRGSAAPATTGTAVLDEPPAAPEPSPTVFCSWCGKERRRDAPSIHHCGSRARPPVYCSACGADLAEGATSCGRCGTDSTTLSPS